ncbi:FTR1 family iron permease [Rhodopila globiformis]|uniref:Iron permease n=1 Tax=Rhodopila globiformis TaxID=1071 RepID=A0A2S6MUN9_RHOGL|nr:FTR1 family protein [Rhodopila globiformis]PPQ26069.1 iron permease [Rhodopila globiformis]
MLASLIVVFREVLEAGLIVGIVLAATQGVPQRGRWIASGIAAGVLGAMLLASCAGALSDALEGNGQEVFNACVLMVAVVMLAWHVLWMARHGREMALQMRAVGEAVVGGQKSLLALAIVVALAVLREGAEVVLFLYGIAASASVGPAGLATGAALGIAAGAMVSWLLYRGLLTIPVRHLFSVTGVLITLLAAGMAGQAAAILAGADLIPTWGMDIWNSSALLPENSLAGRTLHVLIGYSERPMGVQVAAYVTVLALLLLGSRLVARQDRRTRAVRAAAR